MISPLSPAYLNQSAIAQTIPNPQTAASPQDLANQAQVQLPAAPPIEEARPKPENNNGSANSFGAHDQSALQENRSENLQIQTNASVINAGRVNAQVKPELAQSAERSQTEALTRAVAGEAVETKNTDAPHNEKTNSESRPQSKIKSIYVKEDPVITGQLVDSVA